MNLQDREELTRVGADTPSGQMLRRYWWPVALAADVDTTALPVKVLGEELVIFRAGNGKFGLLDRHCPHRGASLEFGRVEQEGIRCCYHGWLFNVEGQCIEQPAEPPQSVFKSRVRQTSYRTIEAGGMIFAYMGPEPAPNFPKVDLLYAEDRRRIVWGRVMHTSWVFQTENFADPYHVMVAHASVYPELAMQRADVKWEETEHGISMKSVYPNGMTERHHLLFPNGVRVNVVRIGEEPFQIAVWLMPIDDKSTAAFYLWASESLEPPHTLTSKSFHAKPRGEYQRVEDGWFNIVSQDQDDAAIDAIEDHNKKEHLASSDRGVIMFRNMIRRSIERVKKNEDPIAVHRGDGENPVIYFETYKRGLDRSAGQIHDPEAAKKLGVVPIHEHFTGSK